MNQNLRERIIQEWNGLPPVPNHTPPNLPSVFQKAFSRLGFGERLQEATLNDSWPSLIGPSLAVHCRPGTVRRGILTIRVDHPAWLHQITVAHKADFLKAVQSYFPHLKVKELL